MHYWMYDESSPNAPRYGKCWGGGMRMSPYQIGNVYSSLQTWTLASHWTLAVLLSIFVTTNAYANLWLCSISSKSFKLTIIGPQVAIFGHSNRRENCVNIRETVVKAHAWCIKNYARPLFPVYTEAIKWPSENHQSLTLASLHAYTCIRTHQTST